MPTREQGSLIEVPRPHRRLGRLGVTAAVGAPTVCGTCPIGEKGHSPRAKALALVTSDSVGKSGHPQQLARDPHGDCVVWSVGLAEPGAAQEKPLALYLIQLQPLVVIFLPPKKVPRTGTAITENR
jgi:hypothetical protein